MTSADKEFSRDSNFSPKASTSRVPTDASPDSKCPICLDRFDNVACLDRCFHRFCFRCVQEWSKNKAECPLCKLPFFSIFHTIRAEDDFKEYILRPQENSSFASPDGRRFRYPTTLTWDRRTGRSSSQRTLPPQSNSLVSEGSFGEPVRHRDGEMQQMTRRPASRRPASRRQVSAEDSVQRRIQEDDMISFRRALYRAGVRIHSIQDGGRYRDISAEFFRCNPACLHRLVPWLKRELTALFGTYASFISTIQHIIMRNVTKYDMESQAFADEVRPFLLNRTEHFLHEFISFARCPFNLEAYDQHANYDCPAPLYDEGSHSDLSVITISPDTACSQGPDNSLSVTGLSQAPWDDETPGPSYSVSEDVPATLEISESSDEDSATKSQKNNLQTQLQANADSNDSDSSSDNCVIVRYVKPLAERTPEVVELSSDSEEPIREEKNEDVNKQQPAHCHSWSDSEPSRSLSPHSTTYKKNVGSCKSCISPKVGKTEAKDDKYKHKVKDLTSQVLSWSSSPGSDTVCSPWNHRLSRNRRSRSPPSCSRNSRGRHGHRSRREHHSKSQTKRRRSRSRDSTKHRSKRSTRRSRAHESKVSLESHRGCFSHESTPSREVSRSRSCSKGHGKRRSRSRDSDRYYVRDSYQGRHQWGCAFCSRKVFGDGFESSSRRKTQSNDTYSRQSPGREHRMRSFIGRADPRSQRGFRERHCHCYERCRSRSRSGSRSRTPPRVTERMRSEKPGGKRKYKTRHLENTFTESTNLESDPKKTLSKFSDCDKNEVSLPLYATSSGLRHSKIKIRSPSVEIVYEGKATEATRQLKKPRKKHRKCYMVNSKESSPLMITIDSDSREVQIDGHCNSTILTGITQISERRNESPSSVLERRESEDVYRVVKETEKVAKKFSIPTRRGNLDGDIRNAEVELQETTANQNLTTTETSSSTETLTSYIQEAPAAPSNQLPSPRISFLESPERQPLMLGVLKGFVNRSSWFNFPEEKL